MQVSHKRMGQFLWRRRRVRGNVRLMDGLLKHTARGMYCQAGDFYIDPWQPVDRALITHAHSDHARPGMGAYLATPQTAAVLRHRLGAIDVDTVAFGEVRELNGVRVSFHPAGHLPGSAQIRVAHKGEIWVASGDYKTETDGLSEPFEPVKCHAFVTESTFGLPVFRWPEQPQVAAEIDTWWAENRNEGRVSLLGAYALGKAQRLICAVSPGNSPILCHGAVEATNAVLRDMGVAVPDTVAVTPDLDLSAYPGALVIAPPSALGSAWAKRFGPHATGFASGWMQVRGIRRRRAMDRGFVMSDHADWNGLNSAIAATGAERVFVTHGYTSIFRKWLEDQGYDAQIVETDYRDETEQDDG